MKQEIKNKIRSKLPPNGNFDNVEAAISLLADQVDKITTSPNPMKKQDHPPMVHMIVNKPGYGTHSVSARHYLSWKKILFPGGTIPVQYMSSTLTALSLMAAIGKGAHHKFEDVDARILGVMYENEESLPMPTMEFHTQFSSSMNTINSKLFAERLVLLDKLGSISIKDDLLKLNEKYVKLD